MADLEKDLGLEVDDDGGEIGEIGEIATLSADADTAVETEKPAEASADDLDVDSHKTKLTQGDLSGFSSGFPAGWTLSTAKVDDLLKKLIAQAHS